MPAHVAEFLVDNLSDPGDVVLDPMVGSGTTLITAAQLGRRGIGFDRDPLAVLISHTVTQPVDKEDGRRTSTRVLERARGIAERTALSLWRGKLPPEDQEFIRYWFPWRSQKQLFALSEAIRKERGGPARDLAWTVFSSLIIAKSAGASHALDISRSRPHKSTEKPIAYPFDNWERRFRMALARHPFVDRPPAAVASVALGDARSLEIESEAVDLVLTSPPYRNAIDYLRTNKFSLLWMGHELEHLRELRGTMVGTERGMWSRDGLPEPMESALHEAAPVARRRAIVRRYLSDLRQVLVEAKRVMREGGVIVLVVGPTIMSRHAADSVDAVSSLAEHVGLRVVGSAKRTLNPTRRSLPPPSAIQKGSLASRMDHEVIIALRR